MLRFRTALFVCGFILLAAVKAQAVTISEANLTASPKPSLPLVTSTTTTAAPFGTPTFILDDVQTAIPFTASRFSMDLTGVLNRTQRNSADPNHTVAGQISIPDRNSGSEIRGLIFALSEPQTVSLLGVGLLAFGIYGRRRLRSR
jgi:hypothetical protein